MENNVAFLDVVPRDNVYLKYRMESVRLRVLTSDGVNVTPDVNIKVTDLSTGKKNFLNLSGDGDKFRISVLIKDSDNFIGDWDEWVAGESYDLEDDMGNITVMEHKYHNDDVSVAGFLDYVIREMIPLIVTTRAVDVSDGLYVVTGNSSRKQTYEGFSIWDLEFTKYSELPITSVYTAATNITTAIQKYEAQKKKNATSTNTTNKSKVNSSSSLNDKLKKCKASDLKYTKTKKVVACVKTLQEYLNKKGFGNLLIDGWYGDATLKAVKKFQQKYKSKYKLTVNGKMDNATLTAMTKV